MFGNVQRFLFLENNSLSQKKTCFICAFFCEVSKDSLLPIFQLFSNCTVGTKKHGVTNVEWYGYLEHLVPLLDNGNCSGLTCTAPVKSHGYPLVHVCIAPIVM